MNALSKVKAEPKAERQSYQNFFRFTQDGYFLTDPHGIIREANVSSGILLGIPENDLIGKPLDSYIPAQERPAFCSYIAILNESKDFHTWKTGLIRHPKQELNVAITASVICDDQGNVSGLLWLVRAITQHHAAEELLRRNAGQLHESRQIGHVG